MILKKNKSFILGVLTTAIVLTSTTVFAVTKLEVNVNRFPILFLNSSVSVDAYNINGSTFLKLADVSKLFEAPIKFENETISICDTSQTNLFGYLSDYSSVPELSSVIGSPAFSILLEGGYNKVTYKYSCDTFEITYPKLEKLLQDNGFKLAQNINNNLDFKTVSSTADIVFTKDNYFVSIQNGEVDESNQPIVIIRMAKKF